MHAVSRDQLVGRHQAKHVQVVYAPNADRALRAKAAFFAELGVEVHLCGEVVV